MVWREASTLSRFFDDCHQHVGTDGRPDLRLYRVDAGSDEGFDAQVLLDPLEEQLDLPATLVKQRHLQRVKLKLIGQEDH